MNCSPENIKDIITFLTPYGAGGIALFFLIYYRRVVEEFFSTLFSWFKK